MEIMNQERYKEYRKELKLNGFSVFETAINMPDYETYRKLEERFGTMPWNFLKH